VILTLKRERRDSPFIENIIREKEGGGEARRTISGALLITELR